MRRGIFLISESEARKASYCCAICLSGFFCLPIFFRSSSVRNGMFKALHSASCLASASMHTLYLGRGMTGSRMEPRTGLSLATS